MIDMFDSTDIQTAYVTAEQMVARMQKGFNGTQAVCLIFFDKCISVPWAVMSSMNLRITLMSQHNFWGCLLKTRFPERYPRLFSSPVQDPAVPGGLNAWSYVQSRGKAMYTTVCLSTYAICNISLIVLDMVNLGNKLCTQVYLSKDGDECNTSFFPNGNCNNWAAEYYNEETMWQQVYCNN